MIQDGNQGKKLKNIPFSWRLKEECTNIIFFNYTQIKHWGSNKRLGICTEKVDWVIKHEKMMP